VVGSQASLFLETEFEATKWRGPAAMVSIRRPLHYSWMRQAETPHGGFEFGFQKKRCQQRLWN